MNANVFQPHISVIRVSGEIDVKSLDTPPDLETLQEAVGGYIQLVPRFDRYHGKPCIAYCNEEGKLQGLPINIMATAAWAGNLGGVPTDVLVGDIVIISAPLSFLRRM